VIDFQYIAFELNTGKSLAYRKHEAQAAAQARKSAGHGEGFSFTVLFRGEISRKRCSTAL
jgi:hypothetical protein